MRKAECLAVADPPSTGVVLATDIAPLGDPSLIQWGAFDSGRVSRITDEPLRPLEVAQRDQMPGPYWDDKYWYRTRHYEDRGNASFGGTWEIERVDRNTGATMRLGRGGRGDEGLSAVTLTDDYVYWGIFGHSAERGVRRVPKKGGPQQDIEIGKTESPAVRDLNVYRGHGILVRGSRTVAWIPEGEARGSEIFRSSLDVSAATFDGTDFYVAESGHKYAPDHGALYRISNDATIQLVGSLAQPGAIAVHGDIVYFMLDESPDIWSVSTAGGTPRKVVVGAPYDPEHGEQSLRLWAHECGLIWLHGNSAADYAWRQGWPSSVGSGNTLRYLPWSALE